MVNFILSVVGTVETATRRGSTPSNAECSGGGAQDFERTYERRADEHSRCQGKWLVKWLVYLGNFRGHLASWRSMIAVICFSELLPQAVLYLALACQAHISDNSDNWCRQMQMRKIYT